MKNEEGVNAMCSGERFGKPDERIAIFVTQGALNVFNREELQGVIGHEFSHAFHQDVALNLKIFSLVFALGCVVVAGEILMRSASKRNSSSSKNNGAGLVILIGFVFYMLGFIGSTFASIIQAAISRQKEFLADASGVQYTRNPNGIKSALQKLLSLENEKVGAISNPSAKNCSHMFFLSGLSNIFATHPPLEERIKRCEEIG